MVACPLCRSVSRGPDPGGMVVKLVVRVVWAPELMIVSVAALLARVVWALA